MRQLLPIMILFFTLTGCIFTPPTNEYVYYPENPTVLREEIEDSALLEVAKAQLGVPYRYGGMSPAGFDCSGFVCYVYQEAAGKKLPRTARAQSNYVEIVDQEALVPGDLLFFDTANRGEINHTGIYLGEGKFIHASSGRVYSVTISSLKSGFYRRAFRWAGRVNY